MKRLFILVLVMALLVSLFIGCGTSQESSQATTEESAQSEDTQTTEAAETEEVDYSNIEYKGTPIEVTETDDGFTWVRPTCYKVDSTNCNEPEFQGW